VARLFVGKSVYVVKGAEVRAHKLTTKKGWRLVTPAFFVTALLLPECAASLEINYSSQNPFSGETLNRAEGIVLRGEIAPGDYEHLLRFIAADQERYWRSNGFILASNGGDVQEAIKIARLIKGLYAQVFVGEASGRCISACFLIFVAGTHRSAVGGIVGIHRPYVDPRRLTTLSLRETEEYQNRVLREARGYLQDLHVPTDIIDAMFQRSSDEVLWLTRNQLDEIGLRPPWYEQFLIAKCGLDKSVERRYFETNDQALLRRMLIVDNCGRDASEPEAKAFLRSELRQLKDGRSGLR
jgi:hypothetical protein